MRLCTGSAHLDKTKPIELSRFTQEEFHNNITAYRVPWTAKIP